MVTMIDDLAGFFQRASLFRVGIDAPHNQQTQCFERLLSLAGGSSAAKDSSHLPDFRFVPDRRTDYLDGTDYFFPGASKASVSQLDEHSDTESTYEEELDRAEIERQLFAVFGDVGRHLQAAEEPSQQLGKISATSGLSSAWFEDGRIADIGKFLLDPNSVNVLEQIIRSGKVSEFVTKMSFEHETALARLQDYLMKQPCVLSTIVLGHDGYVMAARGGNEHDIDAIASWALCAYVNSRIAAELIGGKQLNHIVLSGEMGTLILSDFGQALLVTTTSIEEGEALSMLLDKLEALLH